ncbi:cysteine proteinase [Hortaea werneckii]|nr:cysteine proteinase [Hortaea werneckii]
MDAGTSDRAERFLLSFVYPNRHDPFSSYVLKDLSHPFGGMTMDRRLQIDYHRLLEDPTSAGVTIIYGLLAIYALHQLCAYLDYPVLPPHELVWNAIVYIVPTRLLLDADRREALSDEGMLSQTHAAKSEALRKAFGLGGGALSHKLVGGESILSGRSTSWFGSNNNTQEPTTDAPAGLGNWDNSCYQNSVLQGLSSLDCMKQYLNWLGSKTECANSTNASLKETIEKLSAASNNGKQLWSPAKLKSMSSWQQQDAQEYFSKIMDELDKEAAKAVADVKDQVGLEVIARNGDSTEKEARVGDAVKSLPRNPMEGLLAQRVACTRCGFSEGLSMIPFNCLTVPLGSRAEYDIGECLDEYTALEEISEVDCAKCTLLRSEEQIQKMLPEKDEPAHENGCDSTVMDQSEKSMGLPPELRVLAAKRLEAIQQAISNDDFSDKTLSNSCQIPKKAHVCSTKTRQAVLGRAPLSLVVHVNRSVFDEVTFGQRKNYASVRFPLLLDLARWMLGEDGERKPTESILRSSKSGVESLYRLKAVVTHYGRHENGHYICYRRHSMRPPKAEGHGSSEEDVGERWWRLSDEDVSPVDEETVLKQGGVFMLFYEREGAPKNNNRTQVASGNLRADAELAVGDAGDQVLETSSPVPSRPEDGLAAGDGVVNLHQRTGGFEEPSPSENPSEQHRLSEPSTSASERVPGVMVETGEDAGFSHRTMHNSAARPFMRSSRDSKVSRQGSRSESGIGGHSFRPMAAT